MTSSSAGDEPAPRLPSERAANLAENPFAGQGSVLLDIGGDVGAIVLHLPAAMEGLEVEITRLGDGDDHPHSHADHAHGHSHAQPHRPHVAVVGRPNGGSVDYSAVFPDLVAGTYQLSEPSQPLRLCLDVAGGRVTEAAWPSR